MRPLWMLIALPLIALPLIAPPLIALPLIALPRIPLPLFALHPVAFGRRSEARIYPDRPLQQRCGLGELSATVLGRTMCRSAA